MNRFLAAVEAGVPLSEVRAGGRAASSHPHPARCAAVCQTAARAPRKRAACWARRAEPGWPGRQRYRPILPNGPVLPNGTAHGRQGAADREGRAWSPAAPPLCPSAVPPLRLTLTPQVAAKELLNKKSALRPKKDKRGRPQRRADGHEAGALVVGGRGVLGRRAGEPGCRRAIQGRPSASAGPGGLERGSALRRSLWPAPRPTAFPTAPPRHPAAAPRRRARVRVPERGAAGV